MIPVSPFNVIDIDIELEPSYTYRLDLSRKRISRMTDNEEAIVQAVIKIILTERYESVIYSSNYGIELNRLIGADFNFVISDLERTINEAITVDDRIYGITEFIATKIDGNSLNVALTIDTIIGDIYLQTEVTI